MFSTMTVASLLTNASDVVEAVLPVITIAVGLSLGFRVAGWAKRALAKAR